MGLICFAGGDRYFKMDHKAQPGISDFYGCWGHLRSVRQLQIGDIRVNQKEHTLNRRLQND
jgi:hypothetical protein